VGKGGVEGRVEGEVEVEVEEGKRDGWGDDKQGQQLRQDDWRIAATKSSKAGNRTHSHSNWKKNCAMTH
jgi:hypothetical protein